ncbi:endolytic transglycosylase MltG [Candidatus Peregrinibacteria bacterium]|nr:endolytic transglycosylase MltG [Candidatus Peregrinibacteria bacterium]
MLGIIFFGALAFVAIEELRYQKLLEMVPASATDEMRLFKVDQGLTLKQISEKLEKENFIVAAWVFEKYASRNDFSKKLQSGRFYLSSSMSLPEIAKVLLNIQKREEFFTIPEGLTLEEIDERIRAKGYAPAGSFLSCIRKTCDFSDFDFLPKDRNTSEGYFFPETYAVHPGNFSPEDLARKMLSEFQKRMEKIKIPSKRSPKEIIIMASLLERESKDVEEMPIISGILWKRLDEGWVLGVDATIRYALHKKIGALTSEELANSSPFNTRKFLGLPPTAICNPGENSLTAAAVPEASPYYYYLHGSDGKIHYATTNDEHNENKYKYL